MQTGGQRELSILRPKIGRGLVISLLALILSATFAVLAHQPAHAIDTVPAKMNFQGRLTDSSGSIMPDGTYNMRFVIYDALTGGSTMWSEDRSVFDGTGVTVENGLFSVRLGDVTPIPSAMFDQSAYGDRYFEISLPTPATATCTASACASYTEGPMSPRQLLASSAYAFNADNLDGYDSSSFAFVSGSNTFTSAQSIEVSSTNALSVKNGSGIALLNVDTSNSEVVIGSAANGISFTADGIVFNGTARPDASITLSPEYPGATFMGDGTNNTGTLTSDFCSAGWPGHIAANSNNCSSNMPDARAFSYYRWSTTEATEQDYHLYVRYQMPSDYSAGSMSNLGIEYTLSDTTSPSVKLDFYRHDSDGASPCSSVTATNIDEGVFDRAVIASPLGSCTISANDIVVFRIKLAATNGFASVGAINFDYKRGN